MTTHGRNISRKEMIKPRKPAAAKSCEDSPKSNVLFESFLAASIGS